MIGVPKLQLRATRRARLRGSALALCLLAAGCSSIPTPSLGPGPPGFRPSQIGSLSAAPVRGEAAVFAFQPVSGAPAEMVFALEDLIVEEAAARKINLTDPADPAATYHVQGYVTALGDTHSGTMSYVWDVFDAGGVRIHRFSGEETVEGSGADPWSGVKQSDMASAARKTVDAMAEWIRE